MLLQSLQNINKVLDNLINITYQDMEDIKQAHHNNLFQRNENKEKLLSQFISLKAQIDSILVKRSESGLDISQIINPEEDKLLGEFKRKLKNFYDIHKKFSKMALLVTNFYNNLLHKATGSEVDIGYKIQQSNNLYSSFSLKG